MTSYQETQLAEQLDRMATAVISGRDNFPTDLKKVALALGSLEYRVWEMRELLGLPRIEGLTPV
jgi:hypothetical protein